jgi:hypothetical protein
MIANYKIIAPLFHKNNYSLDIADGLKELLTKYEFTLNELLNIPSSKLSEYLGVDKPVIAR